MTNPFNSEELDAARQLIFMEGDRSRGYPPGSFNEQLIRAMAHADQFNLEKLLNAFPEFRKPVFISRNFGMTALADAADAPYDK